MPEETPEFDASTDQTEIGPKDYVILAGFFTFSASVWGVLLVPGVVSLLPLSPALSDLALAYQASIRAAIADSFIITVAAAIPASLVAAIGHLFLWVTTPDSNEIDGGT